MDHNLPAATLEKMRGQPQDQLLNSWSFDLQQVASSPGPKLVPRESRGRSKRYSVDIGRDEVLGAASAVEYTGTDSGGGGTQPPPACCLQTAMKTRTALGALLGFGLVGVLAYRLRRRSRG